MFNVTEGISQPPRNIIKYCNAEKFRYDDYLAISAFKLLSSAVVVDVWLGESGEIFGRRWAILDGPPPYDHPYRHYHEGAQNLISTGNGTNNLRQKVR